MRKPTSTIKVDEEEKYRSAMEIEARKEMEEEPERK